MLPNCVNRSAVFFSASTPVHTGSTGTVQTVSGNSLKNLLERAGIS